jgi:pilus assembly protein CpaE
MLNGRSASAACKSPVALVSNDADFLRTTRSAVSANAIGDFPIVECSLNGQSAGHEIRNAAVLVVDLGAPAQTERHLLEMRHVVGQVGRDIPVIAVIDVFDEAVVRILIRMRVADILVKPVAPHELLQAFTRVAHPKEEGSQIYTFLPVAGGVGTTTLAIQSALTLHASKTRTNSSTCLVDLNFDHGACAEYLDIQPRLNLKEIEQTPERLDGQLLEGMLTQHPSGLAVVAATNVPAEMTSVAPNIVMGLLNVACQRFDQIVIDMPKAWHLWTDDVVLGSNKVFLVSESTVPSTRKAGQLVSIISARAGQQPLPKVIINRFQRRLFSPGLSRSDLKKALGDAFAGTVPCNYKLVREAIDRGLPLDEIQRNSNVAAAIRRLILPRRIGKWKSLLPSLACSPALHLELRGQN